MRYPKWTPKQAIDRVREKLTEQGEPCLSGNRCTLYDNVNACKRCALGWLIPRDKLRSIDRHSGVTTVETTFPELVGGLSVDLLQDLIRAHDFSGNGSSWLPAVLEKLDDIEASYVV